MKFETLDAFNGHLKGAYPHLFAPLYVIVMPNLSDQKGCLARLEGGFRHTCPDLDVIKHRGSALSSGALLSALSTQSLFSKQTLVIIEEGEKMKGEPIAALKGAIAKGDGSVRVVIGASAQTALKPLIALKECVTLDLSKEKPWHRKDRLIQELINQAAKAKVHFRPDAAKELIERVGENALELKSECEKLVCSVDEGGTIDKRVVHALTEERLPIKRFKVAQNWVYFSPQCGREEGDFLEWIGPLRYHLMNGLKLSKIPLDSQSVEKTFPKLNPKELAKLHRQAHRLGAPYFAEGLKLLLDAEMEAKERHFATQLLLPHLIGKLDHARKTSATP